jgi:hypothetical protein
MAWIMDLLLLQSVTQYQMITGVDVGAMGTPPTIASADHSQDQRITLLPRKGIALSRWYEDLEQH